MSVASIISAIETNVAAALGSGYKEINYTYETEKNSSREDKAFGVGVRTGSQVAGVFKSVTMDTEFFVLIQERYNTKGATDKDLKDTIDSIHGKIEDIYVQLINNKIGIPNIVLTIQDLSFDEPEIDDNLVRINFSFIVKYRRATE